MKPNTKLQRMLEAVLAQATASNSTMSLTPPLPPGGPYDVQLTSVRAVEGRLLKIMCTVDTGRDLPSAVVWSFRAEEEWPQNVFEALEQVQLRWIIGADGQTERLAWFDRG